ncbi:MAG: hypothetical protein KC636_35405 [Myxococcales bacterium]|nr:hypothetical protein [Myxococcales bacterium]
MPAPTQARRAAPAARVLAWLCALALLPLLAWADRALSDHGALGWERNAVRGGLAKLAKQPDASGVLLLGSSTSRDFLRMAWLAAQFRVAPAEAVDGHINGCHQGCTWAEVRRLLAEGRHFEVAVFGVNLLQMCEHAHSKRVLQHRLLLPRGETLSLWRHYLRAEAPLRYVARSIFGAVSETYADTTSVQTRLREALWDKPRRGQEHRWYRRDRPATTRIRTCDYEPDAVAYKLGLTAAILDDLERLADRSYLLLLPDQSLSVEEPDVQQAWARHREAMAALTEARPWVRLVDLTGDGPWTAERFRDGVHLSRRSYARQRRQLARELDRVDREAPGDRP